MARRLTARERRLVARDPRVTALVREHENAVHYWSSRIAALETERDRELQRLEADIAAAEIDIERELLDDGPEGEAGSGTLPFDDDPRRRRR